jgi:hypothetical protein
MQPRSRSKRISRPALVVALAAAAFVPLLSAPWAEASPEPVGRSATSLNAPGHAFGLTTTGPRIAAGHRVSTLGIAAADVLPTSVDLTTKTITPGNQGKIGSCVAWSIGYTLAGYYANAQAQTGSPYAPMYLYSQIHATSAADGGGATTTAAWNVLREQGIAEKSVYTQGDNDFRTMPTPAQIANASAHKMAQANYLFRGANQGGAGINALQASLAAGNPVEIGLPVYNAFTALNSGKSVMTQAMATGPVLGGHALVAVGYNPTGLVVENSWGTSWGAGGYATLGWDFVGKTVAEASVTSGFASVPTVLQVTGLSVVSAPSTGGGTMVVSGNALANVDTSAVNAVTLVNTADPTVSVNAPVVSRSATMLTVTIPAAPQVNGVPVTGAYRVVVTSPTGASVDNGTRDDFTYVPPTTFVATGPATIPANPGGTVTLTGTGFGSSSSAAATLKLTATVANKPTKMTWISDSAVSIVVPAGVPGQTIPIQLFRNGVASAVDTTLKYAANITGLTLRTDGAGARYATIAGRGLVGSTNWTLTSPDGTQATLLPALTSMADVATAASGVLITSDTAGQIKLPTGPAGGAGVFRVSFIPNQTAYPGGTFVATTASVVPYVAATLTKVVGTTVSATGGSVVSVTGTNLGGVDRNDLTAVRLVSVTNSAVGVNVPVTARTATALTLSIPAAPTTDAGTPVIGDYKLLVTTPQGTVTASSVLTYLTPFTISAPSGAVLLSSGIPVVTVSGTGFGATADAFKAQTVTAVLAGRTAAVTWVNDTALRVTGASGGKAGMIAPMTVSRFGVASNSLSVPYQTTAARS